MEMSKKNKIFLSCISVIMLVLAMFPITAFAGVVNQDLYDQLIAEGWSDSTSVYNSCVLWNESNQRFIICRMYGENSVSFGENQIICVPKPYGSGSTCYEFRNGVYYYTTYDSDSDTYSTTEYDSSQGMTEYNTYINNVYGFACTQVEDQFYNISDSNSFKSFFTDAELNSFLISIYQISFTPLWMEIVNILPILLVVLIAYLGIRKAWKVVYQNLAQA